MRFIAGFWVSRITASFYNPSFPDIFVFLDKTFVLSFISCPFYSNIFEAGIKLSL